MCPSFRDHWVDMMGPVIDRQCPHTVRFNYLNLFICLLFSLAALLFPFQVIFWVYQFHSCDLGWLPVRCSEGIAIHGGSHYLQWHRITDNFPSIV